MSSRPIRVAIAGYGLAGRSFHGPLLRALPAFAVTTVVTRDATRRAQARVDFSSVAVVDTIDDIFRAPGAVNHLEQVAGDLELSEITVKVHRGSMMRKMGVRTLADLVKMSERLGPSAPPAVSGLEA